MKKHLLVCWLCFCAFGVFGQGQINLISNGTGAPVYDVDKTDPNITTINPANRDKLGGGYTFEVWYAAGEHKHEFDLKPLVRGQFVRNGVFLKNGPVDIPGVWGGEKVSLQIRVWKTDSLYPNWDDIFDKDHNTMVPVGISEIVTKTAGGKDAAGNRLLDLSLVGAFPSFGLHLSIPEPSVIAIGVIGFGMLGVLRRR